MSDAKPVERESPSPEILSRRDFSKLLMLFTSMAVRQDPQAGVLEKLFAPQNPEQPKGVAGKILDFEKDAGDKELTFEQARQLVGLTCEFRRLTEDKKDSGKDLADRCYILRGADPVSALKQDYPGLSLTDKEEAIIIEKSSQVIGFTFNNKIFVALSAEKLRDQYKIVQYSNGQRDKGYFLDFRGSTHQVECQKARPSVIFRSTLMHEIEHDQMGDRSWIPLDNQLLEAYRRKRYTNFPEGEGWALQSIYTLNFKVLAMQSNQGESREILFDSLHEFMIDYLSTRRIARFGLPYTLIAGLPPALYANFAEMLSASKINFEDFRQLIKSSSLLDFYLKVAEGTGKGSLTEQQRLDFIMPFLPVWKIPEALYDPRNGKAQLKPFFPNLQELDYLYDPDSLLQPPKVKGCT